MWTFRPLQLTSLLCFIDEICTDDSPNDRLGLGQNFLAVWGFDPRPLKHFGTSLDAKIGSETSKYHTGAHKIENLTTMGLAPHYRHFLVNFVTKTHILLQLL
jgi:hypothetical protein